MGATQASSMAITYGWMSRPGPMTWITRSTSSGYAAPHSMASIAPPDAPATAGSLVVGLVASCRMRGPGEKVRDEHGVVAGGVELAVGLVADPHVLDRLAAYGGVLRQREELLLREQLRERIAGERKCNDGEKRAHQISPFVVRSGWLLSAALTKRARTSPAS